jgi:putative flippase GtrA
LTAMVALAVSEAIFSSSKISYLLSVAGVYGAGIVLSFILQKKFTFHTPFDINNKKTFLKFTMVALAGALVTTCLSYVLRYYLPWPQNFMPVAGISCFAIACLAASILTFYLNRRWVFKKQKSPWIIDTKLNELN